jgi:HK97 family phage portal protein
MMKAQILKSRGFNEVTQSDILEILQNPNPSESWSSFLTNYIAFGKLTGNRYIYGVRDGAGKVREMYTLPSQHVQIVSGGQFEPIKGYTLQSQKDAVIDFTREEILHVKDFNPNFNFSGSHLYGQSPLQAGWRTLENNNQVIETSKKQLQNQSARGLLVAKEMDGISKGQAKQLDLALMKKMKQANGSVAITNQPMEWINFGLSAADMELINQYNVTMKGLCNLYGVPVSLMNNTDASSYNNIKEAKSFLFQNAVNPEMIKLRDELNRWMIPMFGKNLYLDFDFTVIPELQEDISEMVAQMDKAWYVTGNEKRQVLQYPEDVTNPQMNEYFVPVNLMPMKNMDLQTLSSLDSAVRENLATPPKKEGEE